MMLDIAISKQNLLILGAKRVSKSGSYNFNEI